MLFQYPLLWKSFYESLHLPNIFPGGDYCNQITSCGSTTSPGGEKVHGVVIHKNEGFAMILIYLIHFKCQIVT